MEPALLAVRSFLNLMPVWWREVADTKNYIRWNCLKSSADHGQADASNFNFIKLLFRIFENVASNTWLLSSIDDIFLQVI